MKRIREAWEIVRQNRKAYIILNVVYYGLVVIFMVVAAFNQPLQDSLLEGAGDAFTSGPLSLVGSAYINAEVFLAIALTFVVNLVLGSFIEITLPAAIIPFSGLLVGIYRAVLWGLLLSPAHPDLRLAMIPHSITLLLEGQGYILAMLAAYVQGRSFLWPKTVGLERHRDGYLAGLKLTGKLYLLVILVLAVAAVYEVIEAVILAAMFSN
ncbi:MAG: hypothetical protein FJZ89_08415 [Chloroflexi bacterium]|nr:hypothetical protein [Chloroflexota bacterium]